MEKAELEKQLREAFQDFVNGFRLVTVDGAVLVQDTADPELLMVRLWRHEDDRVVRGWLHLGAKPELILDVFRDLLYEAERAPPLG